MSQKHFMIIQSFYSGIHCQKNQGHNLYSDNKMSIYGARPTFAPSSSSSSSSGLYVSANTDFRRDEKRVTGGSVNTPNTNFLLSHTSNIISLIHQIRIVKAPTVINNVYTPALHHFFLGGLC